MAQAKAKSNSVVTTQWAGNLLAINVLGVGAIVFNRIKASDANRDRAEQHGWTQRHCDKAAKAAPTRKVGMGDTQWTEIKRAHLQSKFDSIKASVDHYEQGDVDWRMAGAGGFAESGLLLTALCRLKPHLTVKQIGEWLDTRTPEQMKAIKARRDVIEMQNEIRLERAGDGDAGDGLAELDALGEEVTVDEEISALMTDQ
jgi:hypothetical protein